MTGSLSDAMVVASMDDAHQKQRQQILQRNSGSRSGHLKAGVVGLGQGLFGGLISIATQTYTGVAEDGITVCVYLPERSVHSSFLS